MNYQKLQMQHWNGWYIVWIFGYAQWCGTRGDDANHVPNYSVSLFYFNLSYFPQALTIIKEERAR